jgi:hypothetical protein
MKEIKSKQESSARYAEFDFTDEQCICCPKCRGEDIESLEGLASWDEGRFWKCRACQILFEVRQVAKEVGAA